MIMCVLMFVSHMAVHGDDEGKISSLAWHSRTRDCLFQSEAAAVTAALGFRV